MKKYKVTDFILESGTNDIKTWISTDKEYTITTSTHKEARYYVYKKIEGNWEWINIQELSFKDSVQKLNNLIQTGLIEMFK